MTRHALSDRAKRWATSAATLSALLLMSVPTTVGAQSDRPLVNELTTESLVVTTLGMGLWLAGTWMRRLRARDDSTAPAAPEASAAPPPRRPSAAA